MKIVQDVLFKINLFVGRNRFGDAKLPKFFVH